MSGEIAPTTKRDLLAWTQWQYRVEDEDKKWDWWMIFLECERLEQRYECYSLMANNALEGLMVLDLKARKIAFSGAITVDYLATNPKNRAKEHGLKYVGLALLFAAIERSIRFGTRGAIWLESLPGAERFYSSLGMVQQSEKSDEGHAIYVLGEESAKELLEEIRLRGIIRA